MLDLRPLGLKRRPCTYAPQLMSISLGLCSQQNTHSTCIVGQLVITLTKFDYKQLRGIRVDNAWNPNGCTLSALERVNYLKLTLKWIRIRIFIKKQNITHTQDYRKHTWHFFEFQSNICKVRLCIWVCVYMNIVILLVYVFLFQTNRILMFNYSCKN